MLTLTITDFDLFYVTLYSFYLQKLYKAIIQLKNNFKIMSHYQLKTKQFLKTDIDTIWDFASSPANLKEITLTICCLILHQKILPEKMYPGMIIAYEVSPY